MMSLEQNEGISAIRTFFSKRAFGVVMRESGINGDFMERFLGGRFPWFLQVTKSIHLSFDETYCAADD